MRIGAQFSETHKVVIGPIKLTEEMNPLRVDFSLSSVTTANTSIHIPIALVDKNNTQLWSETLSSSSGTSVRVGYINSTVHSHAFTIPRHDNYNFVFDLLSRKSKNASSIGNASMTLMRNVQPVDDKLALYYFGWIMLSAIVMAITRSKKNITKNNGNLRITTWG